MLARSAFAVSTSIELNVNMSGFPLWYMHTFFGTHSTTILSSAELTQGSLLVNRNCLAIAEVAMEATNSPNEQYKPQV